MICFMTHSTSPPLYSQLIKDYDEICVKVLLAGPNGEYESVLIHKTVFFSVSDGVH